MKWAIVIAVLCLSGILPPMALAQSPVTATQPATAPAATQPASMAGIGSAGPVAPAPAINDDFAPPGILLAVLAMLILCVVVILLAVIAGAIAMVLGAALLLLGIVSSSVLIGLLRRTRAAALRAFVIQVTAVVGVPLGVLALWVENRLLLRGLSHQTMLLAGSIGGLVIGAGAGFLIGRAAERIGRFLLARLQRYPKSAPLGGFPALIRK